MDATVNMYHHFCDFLNLYLSLHVRKTEEDGTKMFSTDNQVQTKEFVLYVKSYPVFYSKLLITEKNGQDFFDSQEID